MSSSLLVTGGNGLIGSAFVSKASQFEIVPLDISHPTSPVDITNFKDVQGVFSKHKQSVCVHFAAFTDVTAAWNQKGQTNGLAYQINVEGTRNIAKAASENGIHLINISTAYVFDGQKEEPYTEEDSTNPIEWYGYTKAKAEEIVQNTKDLSWSILRIDQPFRSTVFAKADVVQKMTKNMQSKDPNPFFTDHWFGPTFVDDLVEGLIYFSSNKIRGLFHATSGEKWSDFDFAHQIAMSHSLNVEINPGSLREYLSTTERPYQVNTSLNNSKYQKEIPFTQKTIREALGLVNLAPFSD